ncbi:MAG: family 43 glycosylhydrolase [Paludibacter sp.]|nr:family 43 glycosylhydrolase [Paludibacter sp.]
MKVFKFMILCLVFATYPALAAKLKPAAGTDKVVKTSEQKKQATYINPVFEPDFADPTIIKAADGWFYGYATENTWTDGVHHLVPVIKSKNLIQWQYVSDAFKVRPMWKKSGGIWAPDVTVVNGQYYMFYSYSTWGDSNPGIGLAIADKPEGPFVDQGKLFDSESIGVSNSIDPCLFQTGKGAKQKSYLFWGSFFGIYGIELSADLKSVKGSKFKIAGNAFEASCIKEKNGKFYFFGSVGSCCDGANSQYRVNVAVSSDIRGPYKDKAGVEILADGAEGTALIAGNRAIGWVGPGHNSKIITDDAGNDYFLYHAIDPSNANLPGGATRRPLMMDKLIWTHGWPQIQGNIPGRDSQKSPIINH